MHNKTVLERRIKSAWDKNQQCAHAADAFDPVFCWHAHGCSCVDAKQAKYAKYETRGFKL